LYAPVAVNTRMFALIVTSGTADVPDLAADDVAQRQSASNVARTKRCTEPLRVSNRRTRGAYHER
jgi:hypothetical protein